MNSVGQLASGIWDDLSQPVNPSVTYISGWISSDRAVGKVNALLDTEYLVDTQGVYSGTMYNAGGYSGVYVPGDYYPALGNVEAAIFAEVYECDYYEKKIRDALNGILEVVDGNDWVNLQDADTKIERINRSEILKTYRGFLQDSRAELQKLVGYYRQNLADPRGVDISEPSVSANRIYYSWPDYRRSG